MGKRRQGESGGIWCVLERPRWRDEGGMARLIAYPALLISLHLASGAKNSNRTLFHSSLCDIGSRSLMFHHRRLPTASAQAWEAATRTRRMWNRNGMYISYSCIRYEPPEIDTNRSESLRVVLNRYESFQIDINKLPGTHPLTNIIAGSRPQSLQIARNRSQSIII